MLSIELLIVLMGLLLMLIFISIPVYAASKIIVHNRSATFPNAILASLITLIIIIFISVFINILFAPLHIFDGLLSFIITFFIVLYAYKEIYSITIIRNFILVLFETALWFFLLFLTGIIGIIAGFI